MGQIDAAVQAFCTTTGKLGVVDNVTTFTESEFGRTGNPSSSNGSDPAWDSHHLVLSGKVNGGQAFGTFPTLGVGSCGSPFRLWSSMPPRWHAGLGWVRGTCKTSS